MLERQQREHRLDRAGRRQRVADHRLVRRDRNRLCALAEHRRDAEIFHLVVLGRAGAVRIDVVDVVGREPGIGDGVADAADDRLAVGRGAGAVEGIRHLAAALDRRRGSWRRARSPPRSFRAPARPAPSAMTKPSRFLENGLAAAFGVIVRGRKRRQQREAHQRFGVHRAVGADRRARRPSRRAGSPRRRAGSRSRRRRRRSTARSANPWCRIFPRDGRPRNRT